MKILIFFYLSLFCQPLIAGSEVVRIGYFHGGRVSSFYRTWANHEFDSHNIKVELVTKTLRKKELYVVPENFKIKGESNWGKITGDELVELMMQGKVDGATIGETAFISAVKKKIPLVAVAELGHDDKNNPGHAIVIRNDLKLEKPADFKGLRFGARRSSGGDEVVLREFLVQSGVNPDKDVKIIQNVNDDAWAKLIITGNIDGAYTHLNSTRRYTTQHDKLHIFRTLDWMDPELSQSVLVFSKKFMEKRPDQVKKIIYALMKRIKDEKSEKASSPLNLRNDSIWVKLQFWFFKLVGIDKASDAETIKKKEEKTKGHEISTNYRGMMFPQVEKIPLVRIHLLNKWQELLVKHKFLNKTVDLSESIDNSFVEEVKKELYSEENK